MSNSNSSNPGMQQSPCRVYFNEFNPMMGDAAYLPLCSGKLQAFACTSEAVTQNYKFMPYIYYIDRLDNVMSNYEDPGIAAFSVQIWNEQLCLRTAEEVKKRWPSCLIVFGGTQVPHNPIEYFEKYSFIDVTVRGEGEIPFKAILERFITTRNFEGIAAVTWRGSDGSINSNPGETPFEKDLDLFPSPYLLGYYDYLVQGEKKFKYQALIETNRGCPFTCTFCYWGKGGLSRKYRFFGMERMSAELEWIGKNQITFVYNADSNFGMHKRDLELAQKMVEVKKQTGFPEKVVNLYGKNTDEKIHVIAKLLYENGMHKGLGLSRQSMDDKALEAVKRSNIKLSTYKSLQEKFEADGIPTFTELILGLPGETYDSFVAGVSELMEASLRCQLIIVLCEVYPNTEMGDPEYQQKHGIVKKRNFSYGVHSLRQDEHWVTEYIDYIIGTNTMPTEDWKKVGRFAWTTMTMTSLRVGFYLLQYLHDRFGVKYTDFITFITNRKMRPGTGSMWQKELDHYEAFMNQIINGEGRAVMVPEYGDIYWAIEESSFLRVTDNADQFYDEMHEIMVQFLSDSGIDFDEDEVKEAVLYQRLRTPTATPSTVLEQRFEFNFPEYFSALSTEVRPALVRNAQLLTVEEIDTIVDKPRFAQERLLWGRRGGKFERPVRWQNMSSDALSTVTPPNAIKAKATQIPLAQTE